MNPTLKERLAQMPPEKRQQLLAEFARRKQQQQQSDKKISKKITLRFMNQITSINDDEDKDKIHSFIKRLPIKDSSKLRGFMDKVEPGINKNVLLKCPHCQHIMKEEIEVGNNFLNLNVEHKNTLWEESFLITNYGNGGINRTESFTMATAERRWRIERINEEMQKKHDAEKPANESSGRK